MADPFSLYTDINATGLDVVEHAIRSRARRVLGPLVAPLIRQDFETWMVADPRLILERFEERTDLELHGDKYTDVTIVHDTRGWCAIVNITNGTLDPYPSVSENFPCNRARLLEFTYNVADNNLPGLLEVSFNAWADRLHDDLIVGEYKMVLSRGNRIYRATVCFVDPDKDRDVKYVNLSVDDKDSGDEDQDGLVEEHNDDPDDDEDEEDEDEEDEDEDDEDEDDEDEEDEDEEDD